MPILMGPLGLWLRNFATRHRFRFLRKKRFCLRTAILSVFTWPLKTRLNIVTKVKSTRDSLQTSAQMQALIKSHRRFHPLEEKLNVFQKRQARLYPVKYPRLLEIRWASL